MNPLFRHIVVFVLVGFLSGYTLLPHSEGEMEEVDCSKPHVGQSSEPVHSGIPVGDGSHDGGNNSCCYFSNLLAPWVESSGEPVNLVHAPYLNLITSLIPNPYYLIEATPD